MNPRFRRLVTAAAAAAIIATVAPTIATPAGAQPTYAATVTRTSNGIPHIVGEDHGSVGFGYGYAFAEDNLCTMAEIYVTVNGERSKFFGPDGTWSFRGNGTTANNLDSDFFYTDINESGIIESLMEGSDAGPALPGDGLELIDGYVAGYNRFLADYRADAADADGLTQFAEHSCAGEPWVRDIDSIDAFRRFFQLASLASAGISINEIGSAQPPHPSVNPLTAAAAAPDDDAIAEMIIDGLPERLSDALGIGSNAYGVGGELTDNGRGLVLGNPHFPWHGGERLYQSHLTVRSPSGDTVMNVSGASLYGVPLILIGHTDGLAWSHTVSTAYRFTPFELALVPGDPTSYLADGVPTPMEARTVEVELADGSTVERTLYDTEYGRMMTGILGLPIFPWTPVKAWAMGDANEHLRYLNHFWEVNHAQTTDELYEIQKEYVGIPWVNTMAADSTGQAYYGDISSIPHVTDEMAQVCNTVVGQATTAYLGLPVLDGSRRDCAWPDARSTEEAPAPGIFGHTELPHLFRDDYVLNSNDSHWLSNPAEPLTGFDRIIGDEETARSLRTRLGLVMIDEAGQAMTAGTDDGIGRQEMQDLVFNNRHYAGELVRDDVVAMCRQQAGVFPNSVSGVELDAAGEGCDALDSWGVTDDLDDPGAILFRRFWGRADDSPAPWLKPFDVTDPVNTPNTLNTFDPIVRDALGAAIADLRGSDIALDAPLRGYQFERRSSPWGPVPSGKGDPIPIHGGPGTLGVFNAINVGWVPGQGYPNVDHGSSFVMVAQFVDPDTNGGCGVDASAIVTYSQSENPNSDWFEDQTRMFSDKLWNGMHFCDHEIDADQNKTVTVLTH